MKKQFILILVFAIIFTIFSTVMAEALITVMLDDKQVEFDQNPVMVNERVLVPLRQIFEGLDAKVEWYEETETVTAEKADKKITLTIGESTAFINETQIELDVSPVIMNGRTMLPVRFISQSFGCTVDWDADTQTVIIKTAVSFQVREINEYVKELFPKVYSVRVFEDSYTEGGESGDKNFNLLEVITVKANKSIPEQNRQAFIKYNLEGIPEGKITKAILNLYSTSFEENVTQSNTIVAVDSNDWNEKLLTYNNRPQTGKKLYEFTLDAANPSRWYTADVTEYIIEKLTSGNIISMGIMPDESKSLFSRFSSKSAKDPSYILVCIDGAEIPEPQAEKTDPLKQFSIEMKSKNQSPWVEFKAKRLDSIPGFTPFSMSIPESKYGGRTDKQTTATGFFYTEKIDDRWWMIDPEGYYYFNNAVGVVATGSQTPALKQSLKERFGGEIPKWSDYTLEILKNAGFRAVGAWSDYSKYMRDGRAELFPDTVITYMIRTYGQAKEMIVPAGGSTGFYENIMPVFDNEFITMCEEIAREKIAPYKDDPYFVGHMTDNELPVNSNMLISYLSIDSNEDARYEESSKAAWDWFKQRRGENAGIDDVTYDDKVEFMGFVYDKYYEVTTGAVRLYDPNHMCIGSRLLTPALSNEQMMKAAGKYLDAVSINLYGEFDYSPEILKRAEEWAGIPIIGSEFYTKAETDDATDSGAGKILKTREDTGIWYQNLCMQFIESKVVIGWHYFPYNGEDKGILDTALDVRSEMVDKMEEINKNAYLYADFVDSQKSE